MTSAESPTAVQLQPTGAFLFFRKIKSIFINRVLPASQQ
jgi:hypothetical protein